MSDAAREVVQVDDLVLEVRRSARRKSLGLTIEREGELTITAPVGVDTEVLAAFVRDKQFWIYTKLAEKDALQQPTGGKEFVSGEGFPYLGRSYRLLLVDDQQAALKLEAGRFKLRRELAGDGRAHFIRWYSERGRVWLRRRVARWSGRLAVEPKGVEVRDLGFRWGSCGHTGNLNFHWATMLLPISVVDYVIVHELMHLSEPNHTPEFWRLVARALPNYEQQKAWLAAHGGRQVAL